MLTFNQLVAVVIKSMLVVAAIITAFLIVSIQLSFNIQYLYTGSKDNTYIYLAWLSLSLSLSHT